MTALRDAASRGVGRVRSTTWQIVQCMLAAPLAWLLASVALGHRTPIFAAVAATVCLGVSYGQRLRRVVELAAGVTIGVALGDLLISQIGRGPWQIGAVVGLGMLFAQFIGGGALITAQAGLQGIFLIALPQPDAGLARWQDALLGGGVALLVAAALPGDPSAPVRARADALIGDLADLVHQGATAIRSGDPQLAEAALQRARGTQREIDQWDTALLEGDEISRLSPLRRHRRGELERYRRALVGVDRAARNLRVALRRVTAALEDGERPSPRIAQAMDDLGAALGALRYEVGAPGPDGVAATTLRALATRLDPEALGAASLSGTVVVAQLRSAVVDLLGATGMDADEARALLPTEG